MSTSALTIELDDPDATFDPGDTVSGTVHVDVDEPRECSRLVVAAQRMFGSPLGNSDHEDVVVAENIGTGTFDPREPVEYSFELELPAGPCSYDGEFVALDWQLSATAYFEYSRESAETRHPLTIRPQGLSVDQPYDHGHDVPGNEIGPASWMELLLRVGLYAAGVGIVATTAFTCATTDPGDSKWSGFVFMAFVLGGPIFALIVVEEVVTDGPFEKLFRTMEPEVTDDRPGPGDAFEARLKLTAADDIALEENLSYIDVTLLGRERLHHGSSGTTGHNTILYESGDRIDDLPDRLEEGESTVLRRQFEIPEDAPPSVHGPCHHVHWQIRWTVSLGREEGTWIDWTSLVVEPSRS